MYDKRLKRWTSPERSANTAYRPDAVSSPEEALRERFEEADRALVSATGGQDSIDAVYLMRSIADEGYGDACYAMGQLFEYGWSVEKSKKQAYEWYEKAANTGSPEAAVLISRRKKARANKIAVVFIAVLVIACVVVCCVRFFPGLFGSDNKGGAEGQGSPVVILPQGVEYRQESDLDRHGMIVHEMIEQYDTEEMKSGAVHTNRILLLYSGDKLDLSEFGVVSSVAYGDYITLQFAAAEEAQRCMSYLEGLEDVVAVQFSSYYTGEPDHMSAAKSMYSASPVYRSPVSGYSYYTWGAEAMNFDDYSAYLQTILPANHELTVGVIDTGVEYSIYPADLQARIVDGKDFFLIAERGQADTTYGKHDYDGHGTHVAGTILDCTQGLNIKIKPLTAHGEYKFDDAWNAAILYASSPEAGIDVVSMSMGVLYTNEADKSHASVRDELARRVVAAGRPFIISAGNEFVDLDKEARSPSCVEECVTVAAFGKTGDYHFPPQYGGGTNYGNVIDVTAPGMLIISYYPDDDGMESLVGTSMATPHVAAMAAMMQLEFHESPEVLAFYLKAYSNYDFTVDSSARTLGQGVISSTDPDFALYYGSGMPDGALVVER